MEIKYDMKEYAPLFVNKERAYQIYDELLELDPIVNIITIDVTGIESMTTICAKIIFGRLCKKLGSAVYHNNIQFVGKSDGIDLVIKMGIASALRDDFA